MAIVTVFVIKKMPSDLYLRSSTWTPTAAASSAYSEPLEFGGAGLRRRKRSL
jgi:hypothetical protein